MFKVYVVRLTEEERTELLRMVKQLKESAKRVRRAEILLKADANGANWNDAQIAEAYFCSKGIVEYVRRTFIERGLMSTIRGPERVHPFAERILTSDEEAKIVALSMGPPPKGRPRWTMRSLAREVVKSGIVDTVSYEAILRILGKK